MQISDRSHHCGSYKRIGETLLTHHHRVRKRAPHRVIQKFHCTLQELRYGGGVEAHLAAHTRKRRSSEADIIPNRRIQVWYQGPWHMVFKIPADLDGLWMGIHKGLLSLGCSRVMRPYRWYLSEGFDKRIQESSTLRLKVRLPLLRLNLKRADIYRESLA